MERTKWEKELREVVSKELFCSAHKMDHIERVYDLCLVLAEGESVNIDVLKAAALLHDIARVKEDNDPTGETDHAKEGAKMAKDILRKKSFPEESVKHVEECIISHRYRSNEVAVSKEAKILFDADKLDNIGAIGVARAFVWVGKNNALIFNKEDSDDYTKSNLHGGKKGRIKDASKHSPQMEYETKTKFLIDKMYTKKGREMAKERMSFYEDFLNRLEKEIRGEI